MRWSGTLFLLCLAGLPAYSRSHKSVDLAGSQFTAAEHLRETLNARPAEQRTRHEYQRVLDAYRRVYYGSPTSTHADASVMAVGEVLTEMGRRFEDDKLLHSAIGQFEFLRREYPGSQHRFEALLTMGEIYRDDLNDPARAREIFEEFLRRYPRNSLAGDVRKALAAQSVKQVAVKAKDKAGVPDKSGDKDEDSANDDANSDAEPAADQPHQQAVGDASAGGMPARVLSIRHWSTPDYTRVAIDLDQNVRYDAQRIEHPDRVFFDLSNTRLGSTLAGKTLDVEDGLVKKIRASQFSPEQARVVLEVDKLSDFNAFLLPNPARLIIDIRARPAVDVASSDDSAAPAATPAKSAKSEQLRASAVIRKTAVSETPRRTTVIDKNGVKKTIVDADYDDDATGDTVAKLEPPDIKPAGRTSLPVSPSSRTKAGTAGKRKSSTADIDVHEAEPTASGDRSLIRALGLKIGKIVIDPGHGGHDTGTVGPNGLQEKDLVLDVSRRLGKLLQTRLGAAVVYTRSDDTFIPLETRTAIANQEAADLFVSVHANSSRDPDARGVETYYLNFTSSPDALEVAARENAVSEESIHELQDLVKKIALKEKIDESREFASDVEHALHSGLSARNPGIRDRGVKKAPFIVLIGANMPSILAEISFVSNPGDERRLQAGEYRQRIAESLYRGISKYVSGLSGVKVASKIDKGEGQ